MKVPGAFESYIQYIIPDGTLITRKQLLDNLDHIATLEDFKNAVFMRVFKTGIF